MKSKISIRPCLGMLTVGLINLLIGCSSPIHRPVNTEDPKDKLETLLVHTESKNERTTNIKPRLEVALGGREVEYQLHINRAGEHYYGVKFENDWFRMYTFDGAYVGEISVDDNLVFSGDLEGFSRFYKRSGRRFESEDDTNDTLQVVFGKFRSPDVEYPELTVDYFEDNVLKPMVGLVLEAGLNNLEAYIDSVPVNETNNSGYVRLPFLGESRVVISPKGHDPNPKVTVVATDKGGNTVTWNHKFTRRGIVVDGISYDGISGEEVHSKYHDLILKTINELNVNYGTEVKSFLIYDAPDKVAGSAHKLMSSGCFLYNAESPDLGLAILTHEIGHVKFTAERGSVKSVDREFLGYFRRAEDLGILKTFNEGQFLGLDGNQEFGHAQDNFDELYASAFNVADMFRDQYEAKYFPNFSAKQKELVREIFARVTTPLN